MNTTLGNEMLSLVEKKGGEIDFKAVKTLNLPAFKLLFPLLEKKTE
jgi:hypothetical protein